MYIIITVVFSKVILIGDESRYLMFAENITRGYYSQPPPNISLWNGPGYPLLLVPFVLINSLKLAKIFNAIFLYFSVVFSIKV